MSGQSATKRKPLRFAFNKTFYSFGTFREKDINKAHDRNRTPPVLRPLKLQIALKGNGLFRRESQVMSNMFLHT